jgi:hypothetical protein
MDGSLNERVREAETIIIHLVKSVEITPGLMFIVALKTKAIT